MKWFRFSLDLIATAMAVFVLMIATPIGGIARAALSQITLGEVTSRPILTYFETEHGMRENVEAAIALGALDRDQDDAPMPEARTEGLDPNLARAIIVMSRVGGIHERVRGSSISPQAKKTFSALGIKIPGPNGSEAERRAAMFKGISLLSARLGGIEPAMAATAVDIDDVEYALSRSRASGSDNPLSFSAFSRFLPRTDREKARSLVSGVFAFRTAFSMRSPIDEPLRVTSRFGFRMHPVLKRRNLHRGADIAIPDGTPILAVAPGKVVHVGRDAINGNFIRIDHGHGLTTAYCHASKVRLKKGDKVKAGDRVALSGRTGRATGPHLHFQVEFDGVPVDPELFIRPRGARINANVAHSELE